QPLQIKATIAEVSPTNLQLKVSAGDTKILSLPKAILEQTPSGPTGNDLVVGKSVIVEVKPVNGKWDIKLRFDSDSVRQSELSKSAEQAQLNTRTTINSLKVNNDSVVLNVLSQAQLHQQGMKIEHISQLPEKVVSQLTSQLQQALKTSSEAMPVTLQVTGKQLTARFLQLQPQLLDTSPDKALMAALPKASQQAIQALQLSAAQLLKVPQAPIQLAGNTDISKGLPVQSPSVSVNANDVSTEPKQDASIVSGQADKRVQAAALSNDKPLASLLQAQTPGIKSEVQQLIQTLLRFNAVNVEPISANIGDLTQSLQKIANQGNTESKQVLTSIIKKLLPTSPVSDTAGTEVSIDNVKSEMQPAQVKALQQEGISPQVLRHLFTSPAWLQSPSVLTSSQPGQGMLGGLVQLLQIALLGKQIKSQDEIERLFQQQTKTSTGQPQPLQSATARMVRDLANADNQHNVLKQLKSLLSSHQQSKLSSAEQTLQGQDTFYYMLPAFQQQQKQAEILIKREPEHQSPDKEGNLQQRWQLTMKLDIGELGELLTKVKILDKQIDLDIYTSNQNLLEKVANSLPFLLKRFKMLGLDVEHHKVQLGKIPDTLATKPYQILETMA
ncbi:MAG: flagellar hook-length control protein FliK, partial [Aestuariibacter sp.]|nr:flagellar hook-length control protein FliK [Aestuariibacter sp.]